MVTTRTRTRAAPKFDRAERNIAWIERYLHVPEGRDVGQPMRLRPWQKTIFRGIYSSPTRRAIVTMGRKNGKSALSAMILCLHLCGPEARPNSQCYSAAQSRDQSSIIFNLAAKMIRMNSDLCRYVQVKETAKTIVCRELGVVYRALSAEVATSYGLSPVLVLHDEAGQIKGPRSELYDALETASMAHVDPLSIIISTQSPTDNDLLSILIDDAKQGNDPKTKLFMWSAPDDIDPFTDEALIAANPAAGDFSNMDELRALAQDAKRMPAREAEYRTLLLNQRCEAVSPFISKSVWDSNAAEVAPSFHGYPVYCGLDLSETSDLTALVMIAKINDQWHVKPTFWLPGQSLPERARKDRVPYDLWHSQGHLETTPGSAIEYEYVAQHLWRLHNELDIRAVAFDRFNMRHLRPWLQQAGFDDVALARWVDFGQGFISMSPALRDLEANLLNAKLRHGGHPVMTMCAANSVVEMDPAGNRKLSKRRSRGRIDGMVSLAMAMSVALTYTAPSVFRSVWDSDELAEVMEA